MQTLLDNQSAAISKLGHLKVGALLMEAGTGKTRVAKELTSSIPNADYQLWITPFQNKAGLEAELQKWGGIGCNYDIVGAETISSSDRAYLDACRKLSSATCPIIVVDESLKFKNPDAKRTKRIMELGKMVEYKLILNGTPISRNLLDIWAQFQFLSPKILHMSYAEFKNTFVEWVKITKKGGGMVMQKELIKRFHNLPYLYSLIQPYVFDCDLSLDIDKQYISHDFEISKDEREIYTEIKERYLNDEMLQFKNNNIFLEITQKLQHGYCVSPAKFAIVDEIMKGVDQSKVLIFRKFLASDLVLKSRYPAAKVLSIQSQSMGLNLQDFHTIIIWDKVWDYALIKQMEHRIYRTGQSHPCTFINLNADVNLEALMLKNIDKKGKLLTEFKQTALTNLIKQL
jgi:SNF2 family DNA or RNA helicase